jgi:hypothetical protein
MCGVCGVECDVEYEMMGERVQSASGKKKKKSEKG